MFHTIWMGLDLKPDPCCKCVAKKKPPSNSSSNWHTPSWESQCNVCLKTNHNGTLLIQEVTEASAKLCRSAWEAVRRQQSSISFNVRCLLLALKLGIILWTLHLCSHCIGMYSLFWMILLKNAMGRKFHHSYSQREATNQRYRCNPLWRTQLGSGKVSSSNSSSRTSRTSSSSSSSSD